MPTSKNDMIDAYEKWKEQIPTTFDTFIEEEARDSLKVTIEDQKVSEALLLLPCFDWFWTY